MKSTERKFLRFYNEEWGMYLNYHHKTVMFHCMSGSGIFSRLSRKDYI